MGSGRVGKASWKVEIMMTVWEGRMVSRFGLAVRR